MKLTVEEIKSVIEKAEKKIEELQALLLTVEAEPGGRRRNGERYFIVAADGNIESASETGHEFDTTMHEIGNYYLTETDAIRAEKQIRLFRLLDRFSRQNGWTDDIWQEDEADKWYIYFSYNTNNLHSDVTTRYRDTCKVYFKTCEVAEDAIEKFRELLEEVL